MQIKFEVDNFALMRKVDHLRDAAIAGATEAALNDIAPYVPRDIGTLMNSAQLHSDISAGRLVWATPYARYQYYGEVYGPNFPIYEGGDIPSAYYSPPVKHKTGRKIKHKKGRNPKATAKWAEVAADQHAEDWARAGEKAMERVK